jgi:stress response protein SCP2
MKKVPVTNLDDIDCDAWVLLMENGRWTGSRKDLVAFFNLKRYVDNSNEIAVQHMGDNLTGSGEGDDEEIMIDLSKLPASCTEILIGVTIYKAQDRGQSFDLVRNTFVRVVDTDSNFEICRFNQEDMSSNPGSTTFIAGKLYKEGKEWQFQAIGEGNKARSIEVAADSFR